MKNPTSYLKMQVLGAVEGAPGKTSHARILHVADLTFIDEEGNPRRFTWRTVQTWMYRYRKHGITGVTSPVRRDKGKTRKVAPEDVLEAIQERFPKLPLQREELLITINDKVSTKDQLLKESDKVSLLPHIGGG